MSAQDRRLPQGGEVDRSTPMRFRFDDRDYQGLAGDTLASALLANDVRLVGRSFKYHRPRGIFSAGPEEPNALVELRTGARIEPNTRATTIELYDGLEAASQHRWPSLRWDVGEVNNLVSDFLPAGFYYKTFMGWPGWMFWEHFIRKAAGMGRGTLDADPDSYDKMNAHCDVLVIGGGPAGLSAALVAGRSGARVILVEETDGFGGRLRGERETIDDKPARHWVASTLAELDGMGDVTLLRRTTAFGRYDGNVVAALERRADHLAEPPEHISRQRLWTIRARRIVLAAGGIERHIAFADNDRPGVMLAGAARTYLNRFAVQVGKIATVFANNDDGYRTALDLAAGGVEINAIVDPREHGGTWRQKAETAGIDVFAGAVVSRAHGRLGLVSVDVRDASGKNRFLASDLLAVSGGWSPNVHLTCHLGAKPVWDNALATFLPGDTGPDMRVAGSARGLAGLGTCITDGYAQARAALDDLGYSKSALPDVPVTDEPQEEPVQALWQVPGKGMRFVDYQDDVKVSDIALANREGYQSVEHLKRYTTLGMGTDQGKTANVIGLAVLAEERGLPIDKVGTTTFRPPYTPVTFGAFVGRETGLHYQPLRRSAMHDWHVANGATFVNAGHWLRPQYYLRDGESDVKADIDRAITREVTETRGGVGIVDVSTLGKIDLQGPDTAELLNRLYINGWKTLAVGKARYGLMLREDGHVWDDGTTSRLGENHYFMTTTTANAGPVMRHIEYALQVLWPDLDVKAVSVTEHWAAMAIAGPKSREALAAVLDDVDVSNDALPFMGVVECTLAGIPARVFRISFSGELAYEINVAADCGEAAWEHVMRTGAPLGILPYGTEAMGIMRIEKGHVAGPELDGRTTPADLGLGRMVSSKKPCLGAPMLTREGLTDTDRPSLVGLVPVDGKSRPRAGAVLIADPKAVPPVDKLGHVTSSAYLSPNLDHPIALGLLEGGMAREGETVWAAFPLRDEMIEVRVTGPVFLDPDGERMHG